MTRGQLDKTFKTQEHLFYNSIQMFPDAAAFCFRLLIYWNDNTYLSLVGVCVSVSCCILFCRLY